MMVASGLPGSPHVICGNTRQGQSGEACTPGTVSALLLRGADVAGAVGVACGVAGGGAEVVLRALLEWRALCVRGVHVRSQLQVEVTFQTLPCGLSGIYFKHPTGVGSDAISWI